MPDLSVTNPDSTVINPDLVAHLAATREERLESLKEFLRIPSVSTLHEHAPDMQRAAAWLADTLRRAGIEHVEVADTGGHPVVYGDWLHAEGAPTLIVYGHYDVQPVDPIDQWESPPFEPVVLADRVVARGAADDKGQIHAHAMAATWMLASRGALPVNVRYVFEGEEESTSVHLDTWLANNRDRLAADAVIISDTGFFEGNLPAITIGLRGMMYVQVDVVLSPVDLHSGSYGGVVSNPAVALAQIVTALKGPDGRIRIPGFYDDVRALSDAENAALAELPFDEERFRADTHVPALVGEAGYSTLERKGARPTLDVNGIWGGFQGEGSKTIIPGDAHAKISCRLVADQEPDDIFAKFDAYVAEVAPPGVTVSVQYLGGGRPFVTPIDHPVTQAAARALEATYGRPPVYTREGGSIPVAASFASILGLPVVLEGFTQPHEQAHAPNEWLSIENYDNAIRAIVATFDEVAATGRRGGDQPSTDG
jgi:acetylornithine deacetylase/succinyl-diaminopimelate desuccinylase-like protein